MINKIFIRSLGLKFLLLIISLVIGFIICEILIRIIPIPRFDKTQFAVVRTHLTRGFEFVPNQARERWGVDWNINSEGFRDYEHRVEKDSFRILGLGDSFLVGHEVSFENSFLRQLEKKLEIEVIKMAVTNYGTIQEYLLWEEVGKKYNPDLVLLGIFVGNDIEDNAGFPYSVCIENGLFVRCTKSNNFFVRAARVFGRHSLFARFLLQEFNKYFPEASLTDAINNQQNKKNLFLNMNTLDQIYNKKWDDFYLKGYKLLKEYILKLHKSTSEHNAELIVIIIPTELQIYDWQWKAYLIEFGLNENEQDLYKVNRLLLDFLKKNKIRFVDLLPVFKKAAETDQNLHPEHWHWGVKANRIVALTVKEYLIGNNLIPEKTN